MEMLRKAKADSFFSNSFFIFIIRFFPSLANLAVLLYYSRVLSRETYGTYQNFWIQLNVLYPVICFGVHVLIIAYSPSFLASLAKKIKQYQYFIYVFWVLLLGVAFALLQRHNVGLPFVLSFSFIIAYSFTIILEAVLIVYKKFPALSIINALYAFGFCAIHVIVFTHGFSFLRLFEMLLVLTASRLLIYLFLAIRNKQYTSQPFEEIVIGKVRALWLHLGFYDVLQVLFNWVDKFIISFLFSAEISGLYFNGSMNIPFLPLLLSAAGSAVLIQSRNNTDANNNEQLIALVNRAGKLLSCIVFPIFFFLLLYRYEFFSVLLPKYMAAVPVFLVSTLVIPVRSYSFTTILQKQHKGAIINTGAILDLVVAIALMYPLYKLMGLPGIALSFVISTYLQIIYYLYYGAKSVNTTISGIIPLGNWAIKLIVFAILFIGIHYVSSIYLSGVISLILGSIFTIVVAAAALLAELKTGK
jgi:O-antigen/teichoic acid export membrane protein